MKKRLSQLKKGEKATVTGLNTPKKLTQRLEALGLRVGTEVHRVMGAPFGDPGAYDIGGSVFAIRNRDADGIWVEVPFWGSLTSERFFVGLETSSE